MNLKQWLTPDWAVPSRLQFLWQRFRQRLWVQPALWCLAAIAALGLSISADGWLPAHVLPALDEGVVNDLLHIMASGMLAVSTFALSILVGAFASAASAGTPRATQLVVADPSAQKAIATFLASFVFAIVGIIGLGTGLMGASARFVLFLCALWVLAWVIYALLRWIETLTRIGRMGHTITTVERATRQALLDMARNPLYGARDARQPDFQDLLRQAPGSQHPLHLTWSGHLQFVDIDRLERLCQAHDLHLLIEARTGDFIHPGQVVGQLWAREPLQGQPQALALLARVREAFVIGRDRTVQHDPAFGLSILAEIAQRALSPAVNDPGTAVAVLSSQTRVLIESLTHTPEPSDTPCRRVFRHPVELGPLVSLAFDPVARAGAGDVDVQRHLMRTLGALAACCTPPIAEAAAAQARRSLRRAVDARMPTEDFVTVEAAFQSAFQAASQKPAA